MSRIVRARKEIVKGILMLVFNIMCLYRVFQKLGLDICPPN